MWSPITGPSTTPSSSERWALLSSWRRPAWSKIARASSMHSIASARRSLARRTAASAPLARADVAGDRRGPDDRAAAVADQGQREVDVDHGAVLAAPDGLEVPGVLAAVEPLEHALLLVAVVVGDALGERVADRLGGGVAEQPLGGAVPAGDHAGEVLAEDRVLRRVDDRRQAAGRQLGLAPLADVADRRGDQRRVAGVDRAQADLDRELGAVAAATVQVEGDAHRPDLRGLHVLLAVADVGGAQGRGHQHLDRLTDELVAGVAEQALGLQVGVGDRAVLQDRDGRVGRGVDEPAHVLLAALALADVDEAEAAADEPPGLVVGDAGADEGGEGAAVLALEGELGLVEAAAGEHAEEAAVERGLGLQGEDVEEVQLALDLVAGVAEPAQPGAVDLADDAVGVRGVDRAGGVLPQVEAVVDVKHGAGSRRGRPRGRRPRPRCGRRGPRRPACRTRARGRCGRSR
jgi:hypothetical protein